MTRVAHSERVRPSDGARTRRGETGGRSGVVERAKRRLAEGYYDNPVLLDLAVERMMGAMLGRPRRAARTPGRKEEGRRLRRRRR
jgi:hypothetical protein